MIKWDKILRLIPKSIKKAHLCEQKSQVLKSRAGNNWFDYTVKYSFTLQTELVTNSNTTSIQAHVLQLHSSQKNKCQLLLNRAQKNPPTLSPRWLYLRWRENSNSDILAWLLWVSLAVFSRLDSFITETRHHVGQYHQITKKKTPKNWNTWLRICGYLHVIMFWCCGIGTISHNCKAFPNNFFSAKSLTASAS